MRKRGVGVGAIKRKDQHKNAFKEKGAELQEDRVKHMTDAITTFRTHLEEFARSVHREGFSVTLTDLTLPRPLPSPSYKPGSTNLK